MGVFFVFLEAPPIAAVRGHPRPFRLSIQHLHLLPPCPTRITTEEASLPTLKARDSITLLRVSPA